MTNFLAVCKPNDWKSACPPDQKPRYISDLSGGYLSEPTGALYDRYRLLSGCDIHHFYINIAQTYPKLCSVMNTLQSQAFKINTKWLNELIINEQKYVENGLLMPRFLASLNINEIAMLLREYHMQDTVINKQYSYNELLNILYKDVQRSRYEALILKLAKAYDGYPFYLPAFLDFRGRIYRSGILHFHERDLARSLILFADAPLYDANGDKQIIKEALAFHYGSFTSIEEGLRTLDSLSNLNDQELFDKCPMEAKRPFQFLSSMHMSDDNIYLCPITQDASASAYQLLSYFLLPWQKERISYLLRMTKSSVFIYHGRTEGVL